MDGHSLSNICTPNSLTSFHILLAPSTQRGIPPWSHVAKYIGVDVLTGTRLQSWIVRTSLQRAPMQRTADTAFDTLVSTVAAIDDIVACLVTPTGRMLAYAFDQERAVSGQVVSMWEPNPSYSYCKKGQSDCHLQASAKDEYISQPRTCERARLAALFDHRQFIDRGTTHPNKAEKIMGTGTSSA